MAGKTRQNIAEILSELRAGRAVHYVASSEIERRAMIRMVSERIADTETLQLFTTSVRTPDDSAQRSPERPEGER